MAIYTSVQTEADPYRFWKGSFRGGGLVLRQAYRCLP